MTDLITIIVGVTIANNITVVLAAYANKLLEKKAVAKRKADLDELFRRLDVLDAEADAAELGVKPLKKTAKRTVKKVEKDR